MLVNRIRFLAITLIAASPTWAEPSPSSGTLGPGDPPVTWTGGNISGANAHWSTCVPNVTCETFVLTLRAGDYTDIDPLIVLNWESSSDYDIQVTDADEHIVPGRTSYGGARGPSGTFERWLPELPDGLQPERVLFVRVRAFAATPGNNYSGTASLAHTSSDCSFDNTNPLDRYAPESGPVVEIPVFVHVLTSAGVGALSDETIESQIEVLNNDFAAKEGTPGAAGVDVGLQFRLAGVTRTANDYWFQDLVDPIQGEYWDALARDPDRYLNIYTNNGAAEGLGHGYSQTDSCRHTPSPEDPSADCWSMPQQGGVGTNPDRIVITHTAFGRHGAENPTEDGGHTTTHEVGHYLGLFHVFDYQTAECTPPEARNPNEPPPDCAATGDRICDTPPQAGPISQCEVETHSCGYAEPDPVHNHMNYGGDSCNNQFTPEQARRMRCTLEHYRPDLGAIVEVNLGSDRKISGGGQLDGSDPVFGIGGSLLSLPAIGASASGNGSAESNFAFLVRGGPPPTGNLTYRDKGTGDVIKATAFDADGFEIVGGTHARLRGTATVNGVAGKRFEVELDDAGDASGDAFSIRILEDGGYQNGGPLLHGNVRID